MEFHCTGDEEARYKGDSVTICTVHISQRKGKTCHRDPGSLVLIGGDLNSTIRREEIEGRISPLDKWIIEAKLVSVHQCLTEDDTETSNIENRETHYVELEPRSIIYHFLLHGNG
jgi:hypothetical protein